MTICYESDLNIRECNESLSYFTEWLWNNWYGLLIMCIFEVMIKRGVEFVNSYRKASLGVLTLTWPWLAVLLVCNLLLFWQSSNFSESRLYLIYWRSCEISRVLFLLNIFQFSHAELVKGYWENPYLPSCLLWQQIHLNLPKIFIFRICRINFYINGYKYLGCFDSMDQSSGMNTAYILWACCWWMVHDRVIII